MTTKNTEREENMITIEQLAAELKTDAETLIGFCGHLVDRPRHATELGADEVAYIRQAWAGTDESGIYHAPEPRAYVPGPIVLSLIAHYRTNLPPFSVVHRGGYLRAVHEAVRIEARTQNLIMTDAELTEWVRQHLS